MKTWRWIAVAAVVGMVLGTGSVAHAQEETPVSVCPAGIRRGWAAVLAGTGPLHEYMVDAFAERLDLAPATVEDRLAAGETLCDIAMEQGLSLEVFRSLWLDIRQEAIAEAVADGVLTEEQAEWLSQRGRPNAFGPGLSGSWKAGMSGNGLANRFGFGRCIGGSRP